MSGEMPLGKDGNLDKNESLTSSRSEAWDAVANSYDAGRLVDPVYQACCAGIVRRVLPIAPKMKVLDAGCGTGIVSVMLATGRDIELHALDYSPESLSVLSKKLTDLGINATLIQGDIRDLKYPDNYFDAVVCANTLQHLQPGEDQKKAASELMRVLRPSGKFAFTAHHYSRKKRRAGWIKEGKPGEPGIDYIFRFTRKELAELIPAAKQISSCGFYSLNRFGPLAALMQQLIERLFGVLLAKLGSGHMLLVHGVKRH